MSDRQISMLGATVVPGGVRFDVWAPLAKSVDVVIEGVFSPVPMSLDASGIFTSTVENIGAGTRYRFSVDGGGPLPDPCSRFQPEGVHGPSEVIDPSLFLWNDEEWPGITLDGQVIYELHTGAFTPEGSFSAIVDQLDTLRDLGITAIELMPVAAFPGRWNWGYDGVALFAPTQNYGAPDDLRRLVDEAHQRGLAVLLDVVYNHLGPDGNYLRQFSPHYFTDKHQTPWGEAINYDQPHSRQVRDFVISNACMWIREYHFDGLRLDATDSIKDDSQPHLLQELTAAVRAAAGDRQVVVIAEDARNETAIIRSVDAGGYGLDGVWADDFHHAIRVALTGARENYYAAFTGDPHEIARAITDGFLYQGETSPVTGEARGTVVKDEAAKSFVFCIQNHDQIGNRPFGDRLHHSVERGRSLVAAALLLFAPETPLLFMGQEFAASTPFYYFTNHHEELGRLVTAGRREEFAGFDAFHRESLHDLIPDPQQASTFFDSKLNLDERDLHAPTYNWYRDLLTLRRNDPVLHVQDRQRTSADALSFSAVAVRRWTEAGTRLLIANFGSKLTVLLASFVGQDAGISSPPRILLDSNDTSYGGTGQLATLFGERIDVPARSAAILSFDSIAHDSSE
jgi:maltooligosyltrehalose trehalohydrolase